MENLTKQQIILLTLLVSFVTSIATGIVTVALMQQAPPTVTQTINRIVERTIEKAVQVPTQSAPIITKETVVVKEDDLVVAAVEKNGRSLVRIVANFTDQSITPYTVAIGLILTKDGVIVADKSALAPGSTYSAITPEGKIYGLTSVLSYESAGLVLMKLRPSDKETATFSPALLGDAEKMKLAQAVILLGGKDTNHVETGIVASLIDRNLTPGSGKATTTDSQIDKPLSSIETDIGDKNAFTGDILMNLSGEVIGMRVERNNDWTIIPSNDIQKAMNVLNLRNMQDKSASSTEPSIR